MMYKNKFTKTLTVIILITSVLYTSCSIQKRQYLGGYSLARHNKNNHVKPNTAQQNETLNYTASIENDYSLIITNPVIFNSNDENAKLGNDSCDFIKLKNNKIIRAKVTEINPFNIHFRLCDARGIGKREIIIAKEKVASVSYSNGIVELISESETTAPDIGFDVIKTREGKINALVYEINSTSVLYDTWSKNGQLVKSMLNKNKVTAIVFCGGTKVEKADLKKVITVISDKKEMTDSLYWSKYHFDIIAKKVFGSRTELIKGYITEIAVDTIKYLPYDNSKNQELKISSKKVKVITLYNKEEFTKFEIKNLQKKVTTNTEILKYSKTIERNEQLLKKYLKSSYPLVIASMLLPLIGIPMAITAINYSNRAKKIIKKNPELKKYNLKRSIAQILGIIGLIFSALSLLLIIFASGIGAGFV